MNDDLLFLSAIDAASLIRRRKLSPVEYTDAVLAAIARTQPTLNAFVTVMAEPARAAARAAEAAVAAGAALGPLHGVPVSIKDLIDVAGVRTTHGSHIFADHVAAADGVTPARLKAAGAIIIGKTTTPEFGHKGLTDSPLQGVTRNPWAPDRTPGGSSGGAAAAVAAGLGPLAVGTDGAGSIRGPAASCGIVGLKPTLGAVPMETASDVFANNAYAGPMTRTVADAALMLSAMVGPDERDPWSLANPGLRPITPLLAGQRLAGIRIGYIEKMANTQVDDEVRTNTEAALAALAALGAEIEPVSEAIDWIEYEGRVLYQSAIAAKMLPRFPQWRDKMDKSLIAFAEWGSGFSMTDVRNAEYARTNLFQAMQRLFKRFDFLVSPTTARTALDATFDAAQQVIINNQPCGLTRQSWTAYQYPFNLTGHPAISVPSGWARDGLPTALQIVGRWWADADVLRVAALFEQACPWADRRPAL
ncbi:amidase [Vineibacter terrae]|uniref:Indoleacetamide hydrolase n=1 Tax=Vineibacter terrae TaxID=2586908 RepID=A0A5C8PKP0_9HYPH|nr:amidase family protein [Vineibacter terrae]TXL73815.1 amidase [Vineibacter terrae]